MSLSKYEPERLEKLHREEINILREIKKVCEANGIRYFGAFGTNIGAVRHKGFIPWDDDVDLGMLREDYDRFLALAPSQLPEKYVVQHFSLDPDTPTYFAKVRNERTVFVENYALESSGAKGIYIDIFPFDNAPEGKLRFMLYSKLCFMFREIFISNRLGVLTEPNPDRIKPVFVLIRRLTHAVFSKLPREKCFRWYDRHLRRYNGRESSMICMDGYKECLFPKNAVIPCKNMPFEDIELPFPNDSDRVLTVGYGDYMTLPPVEKRYAHTPDVLKFEDEM